jgi:hypothetical protein
MLTGCIYLDRIALPLDGVTPVLIVLSVFWVESEFLYKKRSCFSRTLQWLNSEFSG